MSKELRDEFLFLRFNECPKERKRISGVTEKRTRNVTRTFTMKTESGDVHQVCAKSFNGTLGTSQIMQLHESFKTKALESQKYGHLIFLLI